jgi:hypothetical protein
MVRRNWFRHHEAAEIKALIDELHHAADDALARAVRGRLRRSTASTSPTTSSTPGA